MVVVNITAGAAASSPGPCSPQIFPNGNQSAAIEREEIMIPVRLASAAVALAIIAAVAPLVGSGNAANQVIEMPDGLKYTDTKLGDGATATAGTKFPSITPDGCRRMAPRAPSSTVRLTAASRSTSPSARTRSSPVGTKVSPA